MDRHDFHGFSFAPTTQARSEESLLMSVVRIEHVYKDYLLGDQKDQALKDITLAFEPGVFLAIAMVSILGAILVGQVWRQHRHLQQSRTLDSLVVEERHLRDSLELFNARIAAESSPARVEIRSKAYGFAPPKDQWRLPDPLAGARP